MVKALRHIWLAVALLPALAWAEKPSFQIPPLVQPVTDLAGLIDADHLASLNQSLLRLNQAGGGQIAVLTLPTLDGLTLEQASIQIVDRWKLGTAKKDDGVLILVIKDSHDVRIEVGQGLEGDLPDAYAKRIVDETMVPLFRQGQFGEGLVRGALEVAQRINPDRDVASFFGAQVQRPARHSQGEPSTAHIVIFMIILVILLSTSWGRALLFFMLLRGSSRRGGDDGFGGGFSGGGGGFSGGGASGKW